MVEKLIHRIVKRMVPTIYNSQLSPREAVVVNVGNLSNKQKVDDDFSPVYAVDLAILDSKGNMDEAFPILHSIPLPLNHHGHGGFYGVPSEGSRVVVHFINGLFSRPYIQTVLSMGGIIPEMERNEMVWSGGHGIEQRIDRHGNWQRKTQQSIVDQCDTFERNSRQANETAETKTTVVNGNWISKTIGVFKVAAMGCVSLVSGARFNITAAETLNMTALNDLNVYTAKKLNATAKEQMKFTGPKVRIGSDSVDLVSMVAQLAAKVSELAAKVSTLDDQIKAHTHTTTSPGNPTSAPLVWAGVKTDVDGIKDSVNTVKTNVDGITIT